MRVAYIFQRGCYEIIKHFSDIEILINVMTRRKLLVSKNTCIGNCYYIYTKKPLVTADISLPSATSQFREFVQTNQVLCKKQQL